jgi:hypothetical protein
MNWIMPGTLDIYSVGDGELLRQIINTLAMLHNAGTLRALAAIGIMIGIILGPVKYIISAGKDVDLAAPLVAFLLAMFFFGGSAQVRIKDVSGPFSGGAVPEYVVNNVPAGIAVTGWIVSGIGYGITQKLEQGYTHPSQEMTKTGYGRSVEWLASIRHARKCVTGTEAAKEFCLSLVHYLRDCSTAAFAVDATRASRAMDSTDPFDVVRGFGLDSEWVSTTRVAGGTSGTVTCKQALASLRQRSQDSDTLLTAFATGTQGVVSPKAAPGSAVQDLSSAFDAVNRTSDDAKRYMLAEFIRGAWGRSMVGNPLLTNDQTMANVALLEANEQSAAKAAMEESAFRQFMQPGMAVIECVLYVMAPFLAIALGFGRVGWGFAIKFLLFAVWAMTWMPALSFINFFQLLMVERALNAVEIQHGMETVSGAVLASGSIASWVTVGSWLAAATPALTLGLIGGSASGLMKVMGGGAASVSGKERGGSPDIASQSAAMQTSTLGTATAAGGMTQTGASIPTLNFGSEARMSTEASRQASETASSSFSAQWGRDVSQALLRDSQVSGGSTHQMSSGAKQELGRAVKAMQSAGYNVDESDRFGVALGLSTILGYGIGGSAGLKGGKAERATKSDVAKTMAGATPQQLASAEANLGLSADAKLSTEDRANRVAESMMQMAHQLRSQTSDENSSVGSITSAATSMIDLNARETAGESRRLSDNSGYSRAAQDVKQSQDAYRSAQSRSDSSGVSQQVRLDNFAKGLVSNPEAFEAAKNAAMSPEFGGSYQAFQAATEQMKGTFLGNSKMAEAAAAGLVLSGQVSAPVGPGGSLSSEPDASALSARAGALMAAVEGSGWGSVAGGGEMLGGGAPASNVDVGALTHGAAQATVASAGGAPGAEEGTERRVKGEIASMRTPEGLNEAADKAAGGAGVSSGQVRGAAQHAEANRPDERGFGFKSTEIDGLGVRDQGEAYDGSTRNAGKPALEGASQTANESIAMQASGRGAIGSTGQKLLPTAIGRNAAFNSEHGWSETHNPAVSHYVQDARDGRYTMGRALGDDAALVVGTMAAVNQGHVPSVDQMANAEQAWKRMPEGGAESRMVREMDDTWHSGEGQPRRLTPGTASQSADDKPQSLRVQMGVGY